MVPIKIIFTLMSAVQLTIAYSDSNSSNKQVISLLIFSVQAVNLVVGKDVWIRLKYIRMDMREIMMFMIFNDPIM